MDRMSPLDASFLHIENDVNHMHIASVAVFEGPPPLYDDILEMVEAKLHMAPRYRQGVRFVPFQIARPVWVDDPHFNIRYHIRHTSLPRPGGPEQLRNLVGRVMAQQLDRAKPLWEMWVAEGLADDRWAILSKTHHCMVDGVAGTDLLSVIMDTERNPRRRKPEPWSPEPRPGDAALITNAVRERLTSPTEQLRAVRATLRTPRRALGRLAEIGRGLGTFAGLTRSEAATSLNGPIGPHRRWTFVSTELQKVRRIREAHGATVNDVVLAAVAHGFRELLLARGEPVADRVVRTLVPVSVRTEEERGEYNNRVSAMIAELPVGIEDPLERLFRIKEQMDELKESKQAVAAEALTALSGYAPPLLLALGARIFARSDQRAVQTVTTNVPGPRLPLFAVGRQMLAAYPYVPLSGSVRIGIAIFSYVGQLSFGITGDYETAPDIDLLGEGIEDGITALLETVQSDD